MTTAFVAGGLLLAACGSSGSGKAVGASAGDTTTTAAAAAADTNATVKVAKVGGEDILVGANGKTLYLFEKDTGTTSACTGGCAQVWPALTAASPVAGTGVDSSKLSTANGQAPDQVVYGGHLLYFFANDAKSGDVNGTKIPGWYPVKPSGDKLDADQEAPPATSGSGY